MDTGIIGKSTVLLLIVAFLFTVSTLALPGVNSHVSSDTRQALTASRLAYVTNQFSDNISIIDTSAGQVINSIPARRGIAGIAFKPNSTLAYITNEDTDIVSVIDMSINKVIGNITVGLWPKKVAFIPDGTRAYVTNSGSANVSVINASTNKVIASIKVGYNPQGIAFKPEGVRQV